MDSDGSTRNGLQGDGNPGGESGREGVGVSVIRKKEKTVGDSNKIRTP